MACSYPFLAVPDGFTKTGKIHYKMLGRYSVELHKDYPNGIMCPCGKCNGCRADKARAWADRMMLELDHSKKAIFVTLTYDDEHIPLVLNQRTGEAISTLRKRDFQLFLKRLRKQFPGKELRYYLCGEYGPKTHRCHGHMILFGLSLEYFPDIRPKGRNELKQPYFISDFLSQEIWQKGFCLLSEVSWKTCAYVARYVRKKLDIWHDDSDSLIEPEFALMSRNPGIGSYFIQEHPDLDFRDEFSFGDQDGSVQIKVPSALLKYLPEEKYREIMDERIEFSTDKALNDLFNTDLGSLDLQLQRENNLAHSDKLLDSFRTQV